jgi:serine/threonine-protein kinase
MLRNAVQQGAFLERGDRVGDYELLAPIGTGGMGRVWVARESGAVGHERRVAIKTALMEQEASDAFWTVLLDEARIASRVQHPNVCAIHAANREGDLVYLVMDWSDGGSLRELLDALPEHRLELHHAARVGARVCAGLHAVHELLDDDGTPLGVVHRDVSPQNILISTTGQVRLTDFGVAKARGQIHAPTQTGEIKGKISYMAPEQLTTRDVDRRADVFALGCVLYECTTGERPFRGDDALATLYQLLEQPLVLPSERVGDYPRELEAIVEKALARDPNQRYATAAELGRALETWLVHEQVMVSDADVGSVLRAGLDARIAERNRAIDAPVASPGPAGAEAPSTAGRVSDATLSGAAAPTPGNVAAQRGRNARWAAFGGAGAFAAALVFGISRSDGSGASAPGENDVLESVPTAAAPAAPAPMPAAPATGAPATNTVNVTIRAEPAHATLFLDDGPALKNPLVTSAPRDELDHLVRATAEGYADSTQTLRFDRSREIVLVLKEKRRSPAAQPRVASGSTPVRQVSPPETHTPKKGLPPVVRKPVRELDSENPFAQ